MYLLALRWIATIIAAFIMGKIIAKFRLPSILGWLLAGMLLGPYAFDLLPQQLLDTQWYEVILHALECVVGLMIGTELVWKRLKEYGRALMITTLIQSLGTFFVVSASFAVVFMCVKIPVYVAFIFGGIALATAPAPAHRRPE